MSDLEPDDVPGEQKSTELRILGENLKGDAFSSGITEFLEYSKTVSRGELPPTSKVDVHIRRFNQLEDQIKKVWNLHTQESLDDYEKREAFSLVLLKACETFINISIDIMMFLIMEAEPHLQYWKKFSNAPRSLVNRCLIYNYIEPKHAEKKIPLAEMVRKNLDYLRTVRTKLTCQAGNFLSWFWKLKAVKDFPNQNEGVGFLKEAWSLVCQDPNEGPSEFRMRSDIPDLFDLLIKIVAMARIFFKESIYDSLQECRKPHHFSRYLFFYAAGSMGLCVFSGVALGLRGTFKSIMQYYWNWGTTFLDEMISRPARGLFYSIFIAPDRSKSKPEALNYEKGQLEEMIRNYPVDHSRISQTEHNKRAKDLDMSLVMDTYTNDVKDMRMTNLAYMPRLLQGLLIQMQAAKVQNYETVEQMDEIIDASDIMIYMLSLVPGAFLAYGMYAGVTHLGNSVDKHTYKYHFRRLILQLHSLILDLKDPSSKETEKIVGNVILTCEKMRVLMYRAVPSFPSIYKLKNMKDMQLLQEDLRLFLDFEYDANQRLSQLARMERFYL